MNSSIIKVGFLVSFDYEYLKYSLPLVYDHAELIAIAIDDECKTWSGNKFEFPEDDFLCGLKALIN